MESTAANVAHCIYDREACQLADNSQLIWTKNSDVQCRYVLWKTFSGTQMGNHHWLEQHGQLAFTTTNPGVTEDCDHRELIISDQLIIFRYLTQPTNMKRSTH